MLVFVTSLWVTEAIPYFVTAMLIPVLVVMMDIMEDSHGRKSHKQNISKKDLIGLRGQLFFCFSKTAVINEFLRGGMSMED